MFGVCSRTTTFGHATALLVPFRFDFRRFEIPSQEPSYLNVEALDMQFKCQSFLVGLSGLFGIAQNDWRWRKCATD